MYIIESNPGEYYKTRVEDTPKIKEAKIFKKLSSAQKAKSDYCHKLSKIREL